MIRVVMDTNVFVSAVGWQGASYRVMVAAAHRQIRLVASNDIFQEYEEHTQRLGQKHGFSAHVEPALRFIEHNSLWVEPSPLGKPRSRDVTDDKFLAAALAGGAQYILSYDKDLLSLEKPFGIQIVKPEDFLRLLASEV